MLLDSNMICAEAQAVTASAVSSSAMQVGDNGGILGAGEDIGFIVKVTTDFATLTSLTVHVVGSSDSALSSYDIIASSPAVALADLTAGETIFSGQSVPITEDIYPYYGFYFEVTGSDATAGAVTALFGKSIPSQHAYAAGVAF